MSTVTAVPLQPVKRSYLVYLWLGIALALIGAVALARQGDDPLTRNARARRWRLASVTSHEIRLVLWRPSRV